eukprot:2695484-Amphidinium_carterae.2
MPAFNGSVLSAVRNTLLHLEKVSINYTITLNSPGHAAMELSSNSLGARHTLSLAGLRIQPSGVMVQGAI